MANTVSSPLCQKIPIKVNKLNRAIDLTILLLLISILVYRLLSFNKNHGFTWVLAFVCEFWFALEFSLSLTTFWTPAEFKTYPEILLQRDAAELPAVDLFVTTADVVLESPIVTVNTVLSLMAVDYPAHKLACYVSDDGCSPIILYSLIEAFKFARLWVPFCKKYDVQVRAPFRYFSRDDSFPPSDDDKKSPEFHPEWRRMKEEYEKLRQKIEEATKGTLKIVCSGEYAAFANTNKSDHPNIIKVIWENKERVPEGVPHLIYVCREKSPNCPHHYKAGAMNVLTRVSGVMTNAPFLLNVDCDMFVNNPKIVHQAMSSFLGLKPQECAFVQFPQVIYNQLKDDPFGTQMVAAFEVIGHGMAGIQGPLYAGTNCFHRRKLIYGFSLDNADFQGKEDDEKVLLKESFGNSIEFINSVTQILKDDISPVQDISIAAQLSSQATRCDYEHDTVWGTKVGWGYGSITEDVLTGMRIHGEGLRSVSCMPSPPGFLGTAPTSGPACLIQRKRWATGLLQAMFSKNSPIVTTLNAKLEFRQSLAYTWVLTSPLGAMFDMFYSLLAAYCIITNANFLPKAHEPAMLILVARFLFQNLQQLCFFLRCGFSVRAWWNNVRTAKITSATATVFGVFSFLFKLVGISDVVFEVTQKDQSDNSSDEHSNHKDGTSKNVGRFTFDESPMFIAGTTFLFVHLAALTLSLFGQHDEVGLGEFLSSVWTVLCFWPFVRGLFGKGKYGIPSSIVLKSAGFALFFVHLCRRASVG
ncbi:Cellulose synthase-like protein H1 [Morus notabilis]|uniref:Cellulose synthase-like protein H1 n=1 Tax=Morus notabilis TaxID=981085 RepID=W9QI09_9ROSA|nr:cellulose synthase-like protein H1 isoform X1 [Morus notabilis]EXB37861.1 Cellulose synthase-like protein H1 [Morus notabilis]